MTSHRKVTSSGRSSVNDECAVSNSQYYTGPWSRRLTHVIAG